MLSVIWQYLRYKRRIYKRKIRGYDDCGFNNYKTYPKTKKWIEKKSEYNGESYGSRYIVSWDVEND